MTELCSGMQYGGGGGGGWGFLHPGEGRTNAKKGV